MAKKKTTTVTVVNQYGEKVEVPVGIDGETPVSPNNPSPKAVPADQWEAFEEDTTAQDAAEAKPVNTSKSETQAAKDAAAEIAAFEAEVKQAEEARAAEEKAAEDALAAQEKKTAAADKKTESKK